MWLRILQGKCTEVLKQKRRSNILESYLMVGKWPWLRLPDFRFSTTPQFKSMFRHRVAPLNTITDEIPTRPPIHASGFKNPHTMKLLVLCTVQNRAWKGLVLTLWWNTDGYRIHKVIMRMGMSILPKSVPYAVEGRRFHKSRHVCQHPDIPLLFIWFGKAYLGATTKWPRSPDWTAFFPPSESWCMHKFVLMTSWCVRPTSGRWYSVSCWFNRSSFRREISRNRAVATRAWSVWRKGASTKQVECRK